jgi:hypothetical protein
MMAAGASGAGTLVQFVPPGAQGKASRRKATEISLRYRFWLND